MKTRIIETLFLTGFVALVVGTMAFYTGAAAGRHKVFETACGNWCHSQGSRLINNVCECSNGNKAILNESNFNFEEVTCIGHSVCEMPQTIKRNFERWQDNGR